MAKAIEQDRAFLDQVEHGLVLWEERADELEAGFPALSGDLSRRLLAVYYRLKPAYYRLKPAVQAEACGTFVPPPLGGALQAEACATFVPPLSAAP